MRKLNIWNTPTSTPNARKEQSDANPRRKIFSNSRDANNVERKAEKTPIPAMPNDIAAETEKVQTPETGEDAPNGGSGTRQHRTEEYEEKPTVRKYKVLKRRQRRRQSLSVSVSEEEEDILREAASRANKSFSSWARDALFKAAKKKVPKRPT